MDPAFCAFCGFRLSGSVTTSNNRPETANCGLRGCRYATVPVFNVHTGLHLTGEEVAWHAETQDLWRTFLARPAYPPTDEDDEAEAEREAEAEEDRRIAEREDAAGDGEGTPRCTGCLNGCLFCEEN